MSDSDILFRAKNGDAGAICELIKLHDPSMSRFARNLCANEEDAQDSVQHARLVIARKIASFREVAAITTWLFSIIKNECYRLQKKMFGFSFHEAPERNFLNRAEVDELFERRELIKRLSAVLSTLDPSELEIVVQKDFEEHSLEELSRSLGISVQAVKSRLHRARHRIKALLALENINPSQSPSIENRQ